MKTEILKLINSDIVLSKSDFDKQNKTKQIQYEKDYQANLLKTKLETMVKPVKPIRPDISDKKKYPFCYDEFGGFKKQTQYYIDYQQYIKDEAQYKLDIELWEQLKMVKDIQRSKLGLCLKKYKIVKQ